MIAKRFGDVQRSKLMCTAVKALRSSALMISRFASKSRCISLVTELPLHAIWSTKSRSKWLKIFRRKLCSKMVNRTSLSITKPTLSSWMAFIFALGWALCSIERDKH
ncbi:hypothetical protein HZ326_28190, partial [Fusarium oxysporum f. sp. albedinis]